ncbi:orotate phosphoribosyltransferase [candidate division KSB1 bacterium]
MSKDKQRLLEIIREKSVAYGEFTLVSGMKSNYYIDGKMTTFDPEGASEVGKLMLKTIKSLPRKVDSVGGPTMGADPIVTAVGIEAFRQKDSFRCFAVRKKTKEHGRQKLIEGNFIKGDRVVIVEDVITTGGSIFQSIDAVEESGGAVEAVIVVVDRMQGGKENLAEKGYTLFSLFTIDEILEKDKLPKQ